VGDNGVKGYRTSFVSLFDERPVDAPIIKRIQIPLIQRDYAQGRLDRAVGEIRRSFLEALMEAISGGERISLDFVYGKVDVGEGPQPGTFKPLDGQQRLTTLFLIHWYLASLAGTLDPTAAWTSFTYETRPSARRFCRSLVEHALPADHTSPARWIQDQPWYLYTWRTDPTIQSMLVMIDAIDAEARRRHLEKVALAAWERLTAADIPAVSFYLLPLDDLQSEEELYIKMNSRGKKLTEFENFKAHFEQDIRHSPRAAEFERKVDGSWSDLMWSFHGGDNIVDDEFIRFIDYITEICRLRDGKTDPGRLGPRATAVFGPSNPRADEHLAFLFRAFDVWRDGQDVHETFENVFSLAVPGQDGYDPDKVALFGPGNVNLFEQCCRLFDGEREGRRAFTLQESLLLYAVLLHRINGTEDFKRRVRVLRNLLAASGPDEVRSQNMPGLLTDVEAIIVDGDLAPVSKLSRNQVINEQAKAACLDAHPELTLALYRLEDHPLLRGTLAVFELDARHFASRADAFEAAFADPANYLALTGALVAIGAYQRRRPKTQSWQFGTAEPANQDVWRYLLTSATSEDLAPTRNVLGEFLDGLAASGADLTSHLNGIVAVWLADRERGSHFDWRYYLVRYPAMRGGRDDKKDEGKTGVYWGVDGELGYSLCMMRTTTLAGYYRDPILLQVWLDSGVSDAALKPWFSGWTTTPRWLRLSGSGVGIRSVAEGFEVEGPLDLDLEPQFQSVSGAHSVVRLEDGRLMLRVPQVDHGGHLVDCVNRVKLGAQFVSDLGRAGL
jgi:Protein of unknown function DUF262